jgi:hypothetical protein
MQSQTDTIIDPNTTNEVQAELAALRARRAELEAARERKAELTDVEQLEQERRAVADAEALLAAIDEHGRVDIDIAIVDTTIGNVIVKRASRARFQRFQDEGKFDFKAVSKLVEPCVVYPDAAGFAAMLERQPAIMTACGNTISRLAGVKRDEVEKK